MNLPAEHKCSHSLSSIASMFMTSKRRHPPKSRGILKIVYQTTSIENQVLAANLTTKSTSYGWPKFTKNRWSFCWVQWSIKVCGWNIPGFLVLFHRSPFFEQVRQQRLIQDARATRPKKFRLMASFSFVGSMATKSWIPPTVSEGKDVPLNHHDMYFWDLQYIYIFPKKVWQQLAFVYMGVS